MKCTRNEAKSTWRMRPQGYRSLVTRVPAPRRNHREIAPKASQLRGSGAHELFRLNTEPPARGLLNDILDLRDEEDNSPRALEEVFAT